MKRFHRFILTILIVLIPILLVRFVIYPEINKRRIEKQTEVIGQEVETDLEAEGEVIKVYDEEIVEDESPSEELRDFDDSIWFLIILAGLGLSLLLIIGITNYLKKDFGH